MKTIKIITIEDDPYFDRLLEQSLNSIAKDELFADCEFITKRFTTGFEALLEINDSIDILIIDLVLPRSAGGKHMQGLDVLRELELLNRTCDVIVISGETTVERVSVFLNNRVKGFVAKDEKMISRLTKLIQGLLIKKLGINNVFKN